MINFVVWMIVGVLMGWLSNSLKWTREGLLLNIVAGMIGAFIAGMVLPPYFGIITINPNSFSLPTMLVSLLGAIILLTIVSLFRRPGGLGLP